jgi:hypothetical protein
VSTIPVFIPEGHLENPGKLRVRLVSLMKSSFERKKKKNQMNLDQLTVEWMASGHLRSFSARLHRDCPKYITVHSVGPEHQLSALPKIRKKLTAFLIATEYGGVPPLISRGTGAQGDRLEVAGHAQE